MSSTSAAAQATSPESRDTNRLHDDTPHPEKTFKIFRADQSGRGDPGQYVPVRGRSVQHESRRELGESMVADGGSTAHPQCLQALSVVIRASP